MSVEQNTTREAVGVFHDPEDMQAAIDELLTTGFERSDINLIAGEEAVREKLGHMYTQIKETEDDPNVPRIAYAGAETRGGAEGGLIGGLFYVGAVAAAGAILATGGTAGFAVAAAAAGGLGGTAVGALLASVLEAHHAPNIEKQLDRGGLVVWVKTSDTEHEARALEILRRHNAEDVHVHNLKTASA